MVKQTPGAHWVETDLADGTTAPSAWVPYGTGFEIPLYFEYEGSGPFKWKLSAVVVEGRARCVRFECQGDVSPENLHRFPLGRYLEEATLMASRPEDEIPRKAKAWSSPEQARAARAAVAEQHHKRTATPRRLTDDLLAEVAEVYRQNVSTGKPSKAVAEHFKYTTTSARRVVREARRRGLLGPARPGRGGEHPQE
jgi:hypothetical protein